MCLVIVEHYEEHMLKSLFLYICECVLKCMCVYEYMLVLMSLCMYVCFYMDICLAISLYMYVLLCASLFIFKSMCVYVQVFPLKTSRRHFKAFSGEIWYGMLAIPSV